ncbi:MAG: protein-L-isoaspartate O-methyltransferase [Segetibacter sp.]|nr:protein-L-isoaspartate O-methyltransferase [Segetibacter sp.]
MFVSISIISCCFAWQSGAKQNDQEGVANENENNIYTYANSRDSVTLNIPNYPLRNEKDLDILMAEIGDARVVLLGEATHGTAEFYTWRAALTKRLIQEKGFDFIASESEWADSYRVNNFIKGSKKDSASAAQLLRHYDRWPTWMWGNYEVASLVTWLNQYNQTKSANEKIGFFGLDVYCLWESMTEVMPYLPRNEAGVVKAAQKVQACFKPYNADAEKYALAVANQNEGCQVETNRFWRSVQKFTEDKRVKTEDHFVMEQNALVALNGERYYRAMVNQNENSWNIRDNHMAETLKRLLSFHGPDSKVVVWEHNTHVGDARYTDMARSGEVNVGQLVRKEYGEENVFIVGFGTYQGSVIAAEAWGEPYKKMEVPKAEQGSWEEILHRMSPANKIILSKDLRENRFFKKPVGHRAIGVVYHPEALQFGQFVPSVMPRRYDAFMFIDQTNALHPIDIKLRNEPPDLYPSGS